MTDAFFGLGGNLGDVRVVLEEACRRLCALDGIELIARSSDFRTPPWGVVDQPPFVNLCLHVKTRLSPRRLLQHALSVEASLGRDRSAGSRWGPRVLDIDLLVYGDVSLDEPDLHLPHPRLRERPFVLVPLAEIAPDYRIDGETIRAWAERVDSTGIERLPPL